MAKHILRCTNLNCKKYTLSDVCYTCGSKTSLVLPPKYSPEDKYGKYRREYKKLNIDL